MLMLKFYLQYFDHLMERANSLEKTLMLGKVEGKRRTSQSILKEISPEYSLERLMLKLKCQYFGYLMRRADSLKEDPYAGKD